MVNVIEFVAPQKIVPSHPAGFCQASPVECEGRSLSVDNLDTHVIGQWTRMSTASPESPRLFSDLHNLLMELHSVHCTSALLRMLTNTFAKEVQTTLPSHFKAVSRRI